MKVPLAYGISWIGVLIGLTPLIGLIAVNAWLAPRAFPLLAAAVWLVVILTGRRVLTGAHWRGIRLVKAGRFREAIPAFQSSCAEMGRRPWVDRYRWMLLGSSSRWTYREMALCNLAFCHGQVGEGDKMRELYEQAAQEFPGSVLASTALRMIHAAAHPTGSGKMA